MGQHKRKLLALVVTAAFSVGGARAELPTGGQIVAGTATVNNVGVHQQNITQSSDKAIINFQSFGIGSNDSVQINQLNSSSILLGRVVGNGSSSIFGKLTANGQLFLVNPNGIYFGAGATLDVGGLMATTLNIRDDDFLSGHYLFRRENTSATRADVVNAGVLKAREGGYVVLAGDYAANRGVVEAKLGTVMLGSAQQLTLDINGDNLVSFALNERNMTALAGVANSGQLLADGGRVVMTASTARTLANSAVNNSGVIQARGVDEHDGAVYLLADSGAITLDSTSRIDVSGDKGGGTVLIGGNFHGAGSEAHAGAVAIASGASIKADAITSGNGGKVAVWSDGTTLYQGSISSRGGARSGDGGFVEVSGARLAFAGTADTSAPKGNTGTLLLDPTTLNITDGAAVAGDLSGSGASILAADANGSTSNGIAEQTLEGLGATTNVVLEATGQITVQNLTDNLLNLQQSAGNSLRITSTTSGGIAFADTADEIRTAGGDITLQALGTGTLSNIGKLTSAGGDIVLQAANGITLQNDIAAGSGSVGLNAFAGGVNQAAGVITAAGLAATGAGTFNLNKSNTVGTLAATVTGALNFKNNGALSIGTVIGTTGVNTNGNSLSLNVNNTLSQQANANITASGLEIVSSAGTVTLTNTGNNVTTLAMNTNDTSAYRDTNALSIGSVGGTAGINSNGNDVSLQSGGAMTLNNNITANLATLTLNSAGGITQPGGSIAANALELKGSGTQSLTSSGNNVATLAGNVAGSISYRDADLLNIGTAGSTSGINTNGNTLTLQTSNTGAESLKQSQDIITNGLALISNSGTINLSRTSNSIGALAADVQGDFTLVNSSANLYTQTIGSTIGVFTSNHNFMLTNAGTLWLGNGAINGTVNAGSGTIDLTSYRMLQYGSGQVVADKLILHTTNYAGLSGAANSVNTVAMKATGAGGGNVGQSFDFLNNKSLTIGTVNVTVNGVNDVVSGITTQNAHAKVQAYGNITLANDISTGNGHMGLFAINGGSYYNIDTASHYIDSFGLALQGNSTTGFSTSAKLLAVDVHSGFNFHTGSELTIGNVWGLLGIKTTGDLYLQTGTFGASGSIPGFDPLRSYTDYYNLATNKSRAGLMIDETINAAGHKVFLDSASGIFQWANDIGPPPVVRNNAAIIADTLMISGTGNFDMSLPANKINHFAADVNGSIAFLSSSPFVVDQQTFSSFLPTPKTITGVQTHAALISGSVATDDAIYTQHNITLAASDDPNGSRAALTINKSIIADPLGQSTVNLTVGASANHDDALVATNAGDSSVVVRGSTLILGSAKGKGAFELRTNFTTMSAAGGKYMLIDNSAQTGQLTMLGIGTSQGGGAPTPVGDFYLTTGGKLLLLGGKSEGNYLQLRADDLTMFGTMDLKDGARVLLQPYHMGNTIGIHNAFDMLYGAGWAQTNYTRTTLLQFGQTAAIYVGSTPDVMNNDASVPNAVKNLKATNEIHIASDGDTGMKMGYRSLSAESTNKIVAYQIGDVYNLRLAAPTVTVGGFNATGERVDLIADKLNLPSAKSYYLTPNNATFLLSPWTTSKSMWIGWIEPGYAASEVNYSFDLLDKLDKSSNTTIIFSGTTDRAYTGGYLRLAHAELSPPNTTHYHPLQSQLILSTTGTVDTSNGAFGYLGSGFGQRTLQNWNDAPYTYPLAIRVESGSSFGGAYVSAKSGGTYSNPATLFGYGKAGGTWAGCADLNTCKGTNPSVITTPGNSGTIITTTGGGGGNSNCTGASCTNTNGNNNNNQPPASPSPDPTNGVNNNAANTPNNNSNSNNNGGNNGSNGGTNGSNSGNNDPGDPANANSNSGMGDGGPSNGGGNGSNGSNNGGNDAGNGSNGGGNGSNGGNGGGNGSDGGSNGGSDSGNGGNGSGNDGSGNNGGGSGNDGSGSGSGGSGNGNNGGGDGSGSGGSGNGSDGSGAGSANGGANGGGDSGDGNGSGSGGSGNGGSGDGNGNGSGSGGSGSGGAGDSGDGGNGNGSGNGGGSSGNGDSGDGSGSGSSGSGGNGSGDSGDGGNGNGAGSGGGSSGNGDSGDGNGSGSGSGGGNNGAGDSGDGNGSGSKGTGSGGGNDSDSGSGNGSGKGGSSGADSGDGGNGSGAGSDGSGNSGSGDGDANGSGSKGSGSGGGNDSDSGSGNDSDKGGNSGADSGDGSGSGNANSKGGDASGGDDSDSGNGKSGKGSNGGGKTGEGDGSADGGDDNASGNGKGGSSGAGDSDSGSGNGDENGDNASGASAADNSGEGGSDGGGSGGGVSTSEQRLCIDASNANRGQDLPDQGGALSARPLLEVRAGGVNMESDCSRNSQVSGGKGK